MVLHWVGQLKGKKLALVEIVHDIWRARNYCVFDNRKANQTVFVVKLLKKPVLERRRERLIPWALTYF